MLIFANLSASLLDQYTTMVLLVSESGQTPGQQVHALFGFGLVDGKASRDGTLTNEHVNTLFYEWFCVLQ